ELFFFSSRRRHTRFSRDWSSDVCSSDLGGRGVEGKIAAAHYCRIHRVPFLGIGLGMQSAVIEYARHVCGLSDASSTELDPDTPQIGRASCRERVWISSGAGAREQK